MLFRNFVLDQQICLSGPVMGMIMLANEPIYILKPIFLAFKAFLKKKKLTEKKAEGG